MAKIFDGVNGIKTPDIRQKDWQLYTKECEEYLNSVKVWAKNNSSCAQAGEVIHFPVADGSAIYVVFKLKPVELIHIDTGDGWHFQYVNRLTAKDIKDRIIRAQALSKLFNR